MKSLSKKRKIIETIFEIDNVLFQIQSRLSVAKKINKEGENQKAVGMLINESLEEINNMRLKRYEK